MFNTLRAALLALSCLCLGEAAAFGPLEVRRSSLDGFDVAGLGAGLDVEEAAHAVARTAALLASAALAPSPSMDFFRSLEPGAERAPHADLLRGPVESFPGSGRWTETWRGKGAERDGLAARRRYDALGRALGGHLVSRASSKASGFKSIPDAATVEIRYSLPRGVVAPAIERAS